MEIGQVAAAYRIAYTTANKHIRAAGLTGQKTRYLTPALFDVQEVIAKLGIPAWMQTDAERAEVKPEPILLPVMIYRETPHPLVRPGWTVIESDGRAYLPSDMVLAGETVVSTGLSMEAALYKAHGEPRK